MLKLIIKKSYFLEWIFSTVKFQVFRVRFCVISTLAELTFKKCIECSLNILEVLEH